MKNILLISFYFSPCTLTPSQRITYWAKNFYRLGYYPTVITREWNVESRSHQETKKPLGLKIRHEKYEQFEVYYLPFKPGLLDTSYLKYGESSLRPLFYLSKVLDVFFAKFTLRFTSFSNFLPFIKEVIKRKSFNLAVISGEPFYLFRIGYELNRQIGLKWFADYRDDWSTNELQMQKTGGKLRRWIASIEASYEKKWVGTSESIISVSEVYTDRIARFLDKKGTTVENGFEEELLHIDTLPLNPEFTVTYSGVLYPSQDLTVILSVLKFAVDAKRPFFLKFLGAGYDIKEKKRIENLVPPELRKFVKVTERLPRKDALVELMKSHVFLSMAYGDMKGIPSSKLYEYMALGKPVLLCPSDNDIMENMLLESGLGFFASDPEEGYREIQRIQNLYKKGEIEELRINSRKEITKYSRFNQLKKIQEVLID